MSKYTPDDYVTFAKDYWDKYKDEFFAEEVYGPLFGPRKDPYRDLTPKVKGDCQAHVVRKLMGQRTGIKCNEVSRATVRNPARGTEYRLCMDCAVQCENDGGVVIWDEYDHHSPHQRDLEAEREAEREAEFYRKRGMKLLPPGNSHSEK